MARMTITWKLKNDLSVVITWRLDIGGCGVRCD